MSIRRIAALFVLVLACSPASALAQPLGTFRWQLQPYCNVLTVNVAQQAGIYTLDGTDDLCGAPQAASVVGIAFQNPNASIGFGLNVVLPGGTPVHIEATIALPALNGTWRDSAGNSGTFILSPAGGTGGSARPTPSGGIAPGSVTTAHLVPGAVGAGQIAPGAVGATHLAANSVSGAHVADGTLSRADIGDAPRLFGGENGGMVPLGVGAHTIVAATNVTAPAPGRVIVNVSGSFILGQGGTADTAYCSITTGTQATAPYAAHASEWANQSYLYLPFGGTRAFNVTSGTTTIRLVCYGSGTNMAIESPVMYALYIPS